MTFFSLSSNNMFWCHIPSYNGSFHINCIIIIFYLNKQIVELVLGKPKVCLNHHQLGDY